MAEAPLQSRLEPRTNDSSEGSNSTFEPAVNRALTAERSTQSPDAGGINCSTVLTSEAAVDVQALQAALALSEQKNMALLKVIPDLMFRVSKDGVVLEFRAAKYGDLLADGEMFVSKRIVDLLSHRIADQALYYVSESLRTGEVQTFSCQFSLPGSVRDFEARVVATGADEALAIVRDVTERKRLEKEVLEISSREQQRIGQDLHDGLGQHLTGISFLAKALERKLAAQSRPEAADAGEIARLVVQALSQTRNLARGLFPVELELNGLYSALRDLAGSLEKMFKITCALDFDSAVLIQDRVTATHVFRIVQEAINNSVKHGKAKNVTVCLRRVGEDNELKVHDDGSGFLAEHPAARGLGLRIMDYRARRIAGQLEIRPGANGGTIVTCTFPAAA